MRSTALLSALLFIVDTGFAFAQCTPCNDPACPCCDCNGGCIFADPCCGVSPILFDLTGGGFALTNAENGVDFDFFGVGRKIRVAWTTAGTSNAWLALDRNGNGTIDNGKELFGNLTSQPDGLNKNGFYALAEFDKPENGGNADGVIDAADRIYASLRLWRDENHNGLSEASELLTLAAVGVTVIDLDHKYSRREDEFGNSFRYRGRINRGKGADVEKTIYDVFLTTFQYPSQTTN